MVMETTQTSGPRLPSPPAVEVRILTDTGGTSCLSIPPNDGFWELGDPQPLEKMSWGQVKAMYR